MIVFNFVIQLYFYFQRNRKGTEIDLLDMLVAILHMAHLIMGN